MTLAQMAKICGRGALVLKEFRVAEQETCRVRIVGRKSGLINWLKAKLGFEDLTQFAVFEDRIEYSDKSRAGSFRETIPLSSVSNLGMGYLRPITTLVRMVVFAVIAIALQIETVQYGELAQYAAIAFGVLAVYSLLSYLFNKTLFMYFIPSSGSGVSIGFKRSLIEGVSVGPEEAQKVMTLIAALVRMNTQR